MKRSLISSLVFFLGVGLNAQKVLPAFGEIDKSELLLNSCAFQPDAHAMNLFESREVEFREVGNEPRIETTTRIRIKVFNEKGYGYATIRIPYFGLKWTTKIRDLRGAIYNLDASGNIVVNKLEKNDFFKERAEKYARVINFTFPGVRPGSVIEFQFTKVEKWQTQFDPWVIQDELPTTYSELVLITPKDSKVIEKVSGADSIPNREEILGKGYAAKRRRIYYVDSVKAFLAEPFMSSYRDNQLRVNFLHTPESNLFLDILTSPKNMWMNTGFRFLRESLYGGAMKKEIPGTQVLVDSAMKIPELSGRIDFIYQAVQKRIRSSGEQTMYPDDVTEAWNNRVGNSAEINLILINLLKKAKITCFPMLISTRDHGKVNTEFPTTSQLNGVDVLAADTSIFYVMDASMKHQAFNSPPANILNRQAYLLNPEGFQWVFIGDMRPLLRQNSNILCSIDKNGQIKGNAIVYYYDYAKSVVLDTSENEEAKETQFFDTNPAEIKILSVKKNDSAAVTEPLIQEIDFIYEPSNSGQFYFINPQLLFLKRENPFVRDTRYTDIDFGCNQKLTLELQLNIPAGFLIEELPKNTIVRAPDTSFIFGRTFSADAHTVYLSQSFEIKRSLFYREDYPAIKEFFTRAFALMAEDIILKKQD